MTAAFAPAPSLSLTSAPDTVAAAGPGSAGSVATGTARPHRAVAPEVYRRRRLAVLAVLLGLMLGLASFGRSADATSTPEAEAAAAVVVVVQPGDTLWSIAQGLAPGSDPRPLVVELRALAGPGSLQPGQVLTVPGSLVG